MWCGVVWFAVGLVELESRAVDLSGA